MKLDFLFGKTLLEAFKDIHNYKLDKITIHRISGKTTLHNQAQPQVQLTSTTPICVVTEDNTPEENEQGSEINTEILQNDNTFTCMTEPNKAKRVEGLLCLVTIGDDLNAGQ